MPSFEALTLVIGNKNYSTWSMRAWVAMTAAGIPFHEQMLRFETEDWDNNIERISPTKRVPVLWEGGIGSGFATWDTLAIIERANELFPGAGLWPSGSQARARARSICAEMHSGFASLRRAMPMNLRGRHPGRGRVPGVAEDIARIAAIWSDTRACYGNGGAYLFGAFCAADAFFAPVAARFVTYAAEPAGAAGEYQQALLGAPAVRKWIEAGVAETEFVAMDEPYATRQA